MNPELVSLPPPVNSPFIISFTYLSWHCVTQTVVAATLKSHQKGTLILVTRFRDSAYKPHVNLFWCVILLRLFVLVADACVSWQNKLDSWIKHKMFLNWRINFLPSGMWWVDIWYLRIIKKLLSRFGVGLPYKLWCIYIISVCSDIFILLILLQQPEVVRRDIKFARSLSMAKLKFPFPHMVAVVMREQSHGDLQLMSQGTADIILDFCVDYWDGHDLCPMSPADRYVCLASLR